MSETLLRLALPVPLPSYFDYRLPKGVSVDACTPGKRVRVPFGRVRHIGVIVALTGQSEVPSAKLKRAEALLDEEPLLSEDDLGFLAWAAGYYHHPVGEVFSAALPLRLRKQAEALPLAEACYRACVDESEGAALLSRAPRQRAIFLALAQAGERGLARSRLKEDYEATPQLLAQLEEKHLICSVEAVPEPDQFLAAPQPLQLNAEQATAVAQVQQHLGEFAAFLLEGVTGSGKTEVYLALAEQVLECGQSVMVLVPEISLTPQLQQRFAARLGGKVAVLHSAMNESEREHAWQRVRLGLTRVVLGTRSLVFNPISELGLIVVDEEHDSSFKQQEGFRYSARDLALVRARRAGCPVVLGSATPSLESLRNLQAGRYQHLQLTERAGGAVPPQINLLDVRDQPLQSGIGGPMLKALRETLDAGEQAMVFLNRRGFAPVLACYGCGWMSDCPRCDARQTLHRASGLLWCHHCGSQRRAPQVCPECGSDDLHPLGQGTEQIEDYLSAQFPGVPLIRIDRDATARRGSLDKLLQQVHDSDSALLVGTQMLAKGHHFPRVTLVAVMDADGGLFSADFRAAERMAQLLMQVAGRAGRGERAGRVLIQTRYPEHPLLQTLVREGYDAFAQAALREREDAEYPPYSHQALLRAEANRPELPMQFLEQVSQWIAALGLPGVELWGPVPAPMARRVGRHRAHLLIQSTRRDCLHPVLSRLAPWLAQLPQARKVRWSLDVDPLDTY